MILGETISWSTDMLLFALLEKTIAKYVVVCNLYDVVSVFLVFLNNCWVSALMLIHFV